MAARAAEGLREEIPAHLLDRHPEVTALLLTHLGSTRLWAGRFEDARAALSTVTESPGTAVTAAAREECLGRLALIDYLDGWLCRAEHKALEATTTAATMATAAAGTEGPRPAQPPDAAHPTGRALPPGAAHPSGLAQAPLRAWRGWSWQPWPSSAANSAMPRHSSTRQTARTVGAVEPVEAVGVAGAGRRAIRSTR